MSKSSSDLYELWLRSGINSPCTTTWTRDRVIMCDDSDPGPSHHVRCLGSGIESDLSHIFRESLLKQSTDHDAGCLKGTCAGQKPNTRWKSVVWWYFCAWFYKTETKFNSLALSLNSNLKVSTCPVTVPIRFTHPVIRVKWRNEIWCKRTKGSAVTGIRTSFSVGFASEHDNANNKIMLIYIIHTTLNCATRKNAILPIIPWWNHGFIQKVLCITNTAAL